MHTIATRILDGRCTADVGLMGILQMILHDRKPETEQGPGNALLSRMLADEYDAPDEIVDAFLGACSNAARHSDDPPPVPNGALGPHGEVPKNDAELSNDVQDEDAQGEDRGGDAQGKDAPQVDTVAAAPLADKAL